MHFAQLENARYLLLAPVVEEGINQRVLLGLRDGGIKVLEDERER